MVYPHGVVPYTIVGGLWVVLGGIFGLFSKLPFLGGIFFCFKNWPQLQDGLDYDPKIFCGKCTGMECVDGKKNFDISKNFFFWLFRNPNFPKISNSEKQSTLNQKIWCFSSSSCMKYLSETKSGEPFFGPHISGARSQTFRTLPQPETTISAP